MKDIIKKYPEYVLKNWDDWALNHPWKIYFSFCHIFDRNEWVEWFYSIAEGVFYLSAGILMLFWLLFRLAFYPFTRFCVVCKVYQRAKKREATRKWKEEQKKKNIFEELGHI